MSDPKPPQPPPPAGKSNIPKEISGAKSSPLKFDPQDETTSNLVKEFMAEKAADLGEIQPNPEPGAAPQDPQISAPRVDITPNQEFEGGDPSNQFISESMAPIDKVEITDAEKETFLKAVLADEPVRLTIELYGGRFKLELRSRSSFEQKRIFDILSLDRKENIYDEADLAMMITRMHYYLGAIMVERINGELFSEAKLAQGKELAADATYMRDQVNRLFEKMGTVRWTSILNALRIFEHKCARLNSEAANEGFWHPQGSA